MSTKTKNNQTLEVINETAQQVGVTLMAAAATIGMISPDHFKNRVVTASGQPAFALVDERGSDDNNQLRREREDIAPHYVSYSETQRTPSRSGKA